MTPLEAERVLQRAELAAREEVGLSAGLAPGALGGMLAALETAAGRPLASDPVEDWEELAEYEDGMEESGGSEGLPTEELDAA